MPFRFLDCFQVFTSKSFYFAEKAPLIGFQRRVGLNFKAIDC